MIIWLNGAFGVGKTTLAEALATSHMKARVYDPEDLGTLARKLFQDSGTADFQDLPIWRELVVHVARVLRLHTAEPIVVPMTLNNMEYLRYIFEGLRRDGEVVHHFYLRADLEVIEARINGRVLFPDDPARDERVRRWCIKNLPLSVEAQSSMPADTRFLDAGLHTAELTRIVIGAVS